MTKLLAKRGNQEQKTVEAYCSCTTTYCTGCTNQKLSNSKYSSQSYNKFSSKRAG